MRRHKSLEIITTTSTLQDLKIDAYLGVVSHQIVIGANLFRDVFSSFRDVFGGAAKGYQKELERWKEVGISEIEKKAIEKNANGIIGLKMDFESVSGGNKSMFMISLSGTAVKLKIDESSSNNKIESNYLEYDRLDYLVKRKELELELQSKQPEDLTAEDIKKYEAFNLDADHIVFEFIIKNKHYLIDVFDEIVSYFQDRSHRVIDEFFSSDNLNEKLKINYLVSRKKNNSLLDFLAAIGWVNYSVLEKLLSSNSRRNHIIALHLLKLKKTYYSESDAQKLLTIAKSVDETYSIYPIEETKQKTLGKDKKGWKCIRCKSFNEESVSAKTCSDCNANQYGLRIRKITPGEISREYRLMADSIKEVVS